MRFFFFFFQAEDGIRDLTVTGVQTCALPIYRHELHPLPLGVPGGRGDRRRRHDRRDRRHRRAAGGRVRDAGHDEAGDRLRRGANGAARPPHGPRGGDHLGLERHRGGEDSGVRAGRDLGDAAPGGRRPPAQGALVKLRDVLKPEHIVVPLRATTVKEATERLAERLVAAGAVADPQRLNAVIRHTWPEDMVSVGEHAFLPHFRTEAVRTLATAVGISPTPIHWEKDPNRTARIVIFIVAPLREAALYLQVVGALARTLSDSDTAEALLRASSPAQVMALAALEAVQLPDPLMGRDTSDPHAVPVPPSHI